MTTQQYRALTSYAQRCLSNHPDRTLTAKDLVADAYVQIGKHDHEQMKKCISEQVRNDKIDAKRNDPSQPLESSRVCKVCLQELAIHRFTAIIRRGQLFHVHTCNRCKDKRKKQLKQEKLISNG